MYIRHILKYRKIALGLWATIIIFFCAVLVMRLLSTAPVVDNSVGIWFQKDDPELLRYQQYNKAFGEQEWTLLMLKAESIYSPDFLKTLEEISHRIEHLPHVIKVTSIANVRDNFTSPDDSLYYSQIYPQDLKASELIHPQQLKQLRQMLSANPIFTDNLIKADNDKVTVVLIQNDNFIHDPSPYRIELVDGINDILDDYPIIQERALAGTTVVNAELNRAAKNDVYLYYVLISLLLLVFGWLNFKNIRDLLALFAVVLGSVIPSMGLIALLSIPYNMITVMLPTILVSLAVAGVVHVINEFHTQHRHATGIVALQRAMQNLWKPCLYTALTTMFGFATLTMSTVEPVFQLGLYAGIGIFLAWITSVTIAPMLLFMLWRQPKPIGRNNNPLFRKLVSPAWVFNYQGLKWLLFATLVIPVVGISKLETDTNYTRFFDDSTGVTRAYDNIREAGFAQNPVSIVIEYPQGTGFSDKRYFRSVVEFEEQVKQLPQVIKIISANALFRQLDKAFNGDQTSEAILRAYSTRQVAQLLFLGELSGNDDLDDVLLKDKSRTQILALTPYMSSRELDQFRAQITDLKKQYLPQDLKVYVTGTTVLWANMDEQVSTTQLYSVAGVSLFLLLLFIGMFRSWRLVFVALLVNALPLAITLGMMGLLGLKINIATALIGGITLGIVVDDTIHLLNRINHFINQGLAITQAIENAVAHVGKSIVNTTMIIAGGFACLATSSFLPSAQFGIFVTLAITIALLLDLYLAPLMLKALYRSDAGRTEAAIETLLQKEPSATEQNTL